MGYSVSVITRSHRLCTRMQAFLEDAYRPWPEIFDETEESQFRGPTSNLSYAHAKHQLGFDYRACGGAEREYVYALVRWVALHTSRRKRRFAVGILGQPVPYYVYDECEAIPVLLGTEWPNLSAKMRAYRVDPYGLHLDGDEVSRSLAWHFIPEGTFRRISITHREKSANVVREALIESGLKQARTVLQFIQAEIARLDVLWPSYSD